MSTRGIGKATISNMSGSEQSSVSSSFLTNLRILGYKILKSLEEKDVKDIDVPELGPCSECNEEIFSFPIIGFTTLACGHTYHRLCIEKKLPNFCPFPGCGKDVDTIEARRFAIIPIKRFFGYINPDGRKVYNNFANNTRRSYGRCRGCRISTNRK